MSLKFYYKDEINIEGGITMMKFYYDESEHSRKINDSTILASQYYDNFVTAIVGWDEKNELQIQSKYFSFEEKHKLRKSKGEIKSNTLKPKNLEHGFASSDSNTIFFLADFFSVFDENLYLYFSVNSKLEYIVKQLLIGYNKMGYIDTTAFVYVVSKAINIYKPEKVIRAIYDNDSKLKNLFIEFFEERIEENKKNSLLKSKEISSFEICVKILKRINRYIRINWDYHFSFIGFTKYLDEQKQDVKSVNLIIDKEGDGKTLEAARNVGFINASEEESSDYFGIRIADMVAGLLAKLQKSIRRSLTYGNLEDTQTKKLLPVEWFDINDKQLNLYKKLNYIITKLNDVWYKSFSGVYADDLAALVIIVNYFSKFETVEKLKKINAIEHQERINTLIIEKIKDHLGEG